MGAVSARLVVAPECYIRAKVVSALYNYAPAWLKTLIYSEYIPDKWQQSFAVSFQSITLENQIFGSILHLNIILKIE